MTDKLDLPNLATYLRYSTWDLVRRPGTIFSSQSVEKMLDCIWLRRYRLPSQKLTGRLWEANWLYELFIFAETETVATKCFEIMQRFPTPVFIPGTQLLHDDFSGDLSAWSLCTGSIVAGELKLDLGELCEQTFAAANSFELSFRITDVTQGSIIARLEDAGGTKFVQITSSGATLSVSTDLVAITTIATIANGVDYTVKLNAIGGTCHVYVGGICVNTLLYTSSTLTAFYTSCGGLAPGIVYVDNVTISTMTSLTWIPSERVHELAMGPPAPSPFDLKELSWKLTFVYSYLEEIT